MGEIRFNEIGLKDVSFSQIGLGQIGFSEIGSKKVSIGEINTFKIRMAEIKAGKVIAGKIGSTQVWLWGLLVATEFIPFLDSTLDQEINMFWIRHVLKEGEGQREVN